MLVVKEEESSVCVRNKMLALKVADDYDFIVFGDAEIDQSLLQAIVIHTKRVMRDKEGRFKIPPGIFMYHDGEFEHAFSVAKDEAFLKRKIVEYLILGSVVYLPSLQEVASEGGWHECGNLLVPVRVMDFQGVAFTS